MAMVQPKTVKLIQTVRLKSAVAIVQNALRPAELAVVADDPAEAAVVAVDSVVAAAVVVVVVAAVAAVAVVVVVAEAVVAVAAVDVNIVLFIWSKTH